MELRAAATTHIIETHKFGLSMKNQAIFAFTSIPQPVAFEYRPYGAGRNQTRVMNEEKPQIHRKQVR